MAGARPLLDLGTGDGALAFLFESLGYAVYACDHAGTNINRMEGVRRLAVALGSQVEIEDIDLDGGWFHSGSMGLLCFWARCITSRTRSPSWKGYPSTPGTAS
jgi:hypothetical protein